MKECYVNARAQLKLPVYDMQCTDYWIILYDNNNTQYLILK